MKGAKPDPGSRCAPLRRLLEGRDGDGHWERILAELEFAEKLLPAFSERSRQWEGLLRQSLDRLDEEARGGGDGRAVVESVERALEPIGETARTFTVHCIGHAHLDMNWLWPWNDTVLTSHAMFDTALRLMEEFDGFRFSQSQAALYQAMERFSPSTAARMRTAIDEGRWEVTASAWVEGDRNLPCGESLVRQMLLARRYLRDSWGVPEEAVRVDWAPDTFGHSAGVPQLLARGGVTRCYLCRGGGQHKAFVWQGIDGSKVLVWNDASLWYLGSVTATDVLEAVDHYVRTGLRDYPMVYGVGDHGGGPTRKDLLSLRSMAGWPIFPRIRFSTAREFFDTLEPNAPSLPVVTGELNGVFRGCYSSQARVKQAHRDAESRLLTAESLSALAALLTGLPYPSAILRQAWIDILFNQFHDILPGSGTPETYSYTLALLQNARAATDVTTREATAAIVPSSAAGEDDERLIVAFNPLPHPRSESVHADVFHVFRAEDPLELLDPDGGAVPLQVCEGAAHDIPFLRVTFTARDVPGWGYRRYRLRRSRPQQPGIPAQPEPSREGLRIVQNDTQRVVIQNEHYRVAVETGSGALSSIRDLAADRELLPAGRQASLLRLVREAPHPMTAWETGPIAEQEDILAGASVEVQEAGPARITVRSRVKRGLSTFTLLTMLSGGVPRLDFRLLVDWHEKGSELNGVPGLRVFFPLDLRDPRATFDIPFGIIERPLDGLDAPGLTWVDVAGVDAGGAVRGLTLALGGNHGICVTPDGLSLTILRSTYEPDLEPDQGAHEFEYSLAPHAGPCDPRACALLGAGRNRPPIAVVGSSLWRSQPDSAGLLWIDSGSVVASAIRVAEGGEDIVLRLFETCGAAAVARIVFGFAVAATIEADLLERPISEPSPVVGARQELAFRPFEIKTLLVRRPRA